MPNTKSAQKRQRSNVAKEQSNKDAKSRVRTLEKKFRTVAAGDDKAAATEAHRLAVSALDKAWKNGVLHRSTVSRKKSRLAKVLAAGA
ncbi:MAG: 30S ribosomal protein S20 [Limisphaerales bacterium]